MTESELIAQLEKGKAAGTFQFQVYADKVALCKILIKNPLERILEIGTGCYSTPIWQFLLEGKGEVLSVDVSLARIEKARPLVDPNLVKFIQGDSAKIQTVQQVETHFDYGSVDFLFIDAEHGYRFVRPDYDNYSSFVKTGGVVALHDTIMVGPGTLLAELQKEGLKVDEIKGGCGIGVIYR